MKSVKPASAIKKAQREAELHRVVAELFTQQALDDQRLRGVYVNRVSLNADRSICTVFFFNEDGKARFDEIFPTLILYKPSLRHAVAQKVAGRYTPDLVFRFDEQYAKQLALEQLIESVKNR